MRVLVPFDLRPNSERAVAFAASAYGSREDVELFAIHFVDEQVETVDHITTEAVRDIIGETACSLDVRVVEAGSNTDSPRHVGDQILAFCREHNIDSVVMGYNDRSVVQQFLEGSASDRVVNEREVPVTLVP